MALYQWSTTPASNATAGSINWAEGQAPSTVNDSARQLMADVATYMVDPQFYNFGDTPTYVSATQFTVPGNQTAHYAVNRRIKATVTAGTIYGSITVSAYTTLTTITVVWDSGSLDAGLSAVYLAIVTDKVQSAVSATSATSATTATNIAGGAAGSLPYQSGAGATALLAKGTDGQVLTLASGVPSWSAKITSGTSQASTSGTSITFTGIPSWAKQISVMFSGVSTSGISTPIIQLGTSGGVEATGYLGSAVGVAGSNSTAAANYTTGFGIDSDVTAAATIHGTLTISLVDSATNKWAASGTFGRSDTARMGISGGSKALAAALDRINITTVGGTDTFDAGLINIIYQ